MTAEPSIRHPVEQLAEEFVSRYRRGEHPSVSEYTARYPELADEIRHLLQALSLIEDLGRSEGRSGPALLPATRPPERLGDFRVVRELGRGGMGVVYEAEQASLGRRVALKVLPLSGDPTRLERFQREAKAAARLHHTNIVPVFGVGEQDGVHFYAMQFIEGQGLDEVLEEVKRLRAPEMTVGEAVPSRPPSSTAKIDGLAAATTLADPDRQYYQNVARIGLQVAEALAYAHEQGVLHRDIKLSNILLDTHGTAWVTDFGLALTGDLEPLTRTGDVVGTLRYLAPERFNGEADPRSDIYSLGATLYELLTLRPAFADTDRNRLVRRILQEEPTRPSKLDRHVSSDLETIVLKALAKEPRDRYATAAEMAADLRLLLTDQPIQARRNSPLERSWRWCRRNPDVASLSGLVLFVLLTALALVSWQWRRAERNFTESEAQRERADANFATAYAAVDRLLTQLSVEDLKNVPQARPIRQRLLQEALPLYERFIRDNGDDPRLREDVAKAQAHLGQIQNGLGDHAGAETAWRAALALTQDLAAAAPGEPRHRKVLCDYWELLGISLSDRNRLDEAEQAFQSGLAEAKRLGTDFPDEPGTPFRHATLYNAYAQLLARRNRPAEEVKAYAAARELLEPEVQRAGSPLGYRRMLATVLDNLAVSYRGTNRQVETGPLFARAVALHREYVAGNPEEPSARRDLARACNNYGVWLDRNGRDAEAEAAYRETRDMYAKLVADHAQVPEYQLGLASAQINLAWYLSKRRQKPEEADADSRGAVALLEALVPRFPSVADFRSKLGFALQTRVYVLHQNRRDLAECRPLCLRAIDIQRSALALQPNNPTYREGLRQHYAWLHTILGARPDHAALAELAKRFAADFASATDRYQVGGYFARCVGLVQKDASLPPERRAELADSYARLALEHLRASVQMGFRDRLRLAKDAAFTAVRDRPEFQLLRDLAQPDPSKSKSPP